MQTPTGVPYVLQHPRLRTKLFKRQTNGSLISFNEPFVCPHVHQALRLCDFGGIVLGLWGRIVLRVGRDEVKQFFARTL